MNYALMLSISDEAITEFERVREAITYQDKFDNGGYKEFFPQLNHAPDTYIASWDDVRGWVNIQE